MFINHKPPLGMVILIGYPRRITRFFDGILPYFYRHERSMCIPITTRQPPRHSRRTVTAVANWSKNQLRISRPKKNNRLFMPQWSRCSIDVVWKLHVLSTQKSVFRCVQKGMELPTLNCRQTAGTWSVEISAGNGRLRHLVEIGGSEPLKPKRARNSH
jgi:hypothetical protein